MAELLDPVLPFADDAVVVACLRDGAWLVMAVCTFVTSEAPTRLLTASASGQAWE